MDSRHSAWALCLLLVISGCLGYAPRPPGPAQSASDSHRQLTVTGTAGGTLRFNTTRPMRFVASDLQARPVAPRVTVYDREPTTTRYTVRDVARRSPLSAQAVRRLGYENYTVQLDGASGYATGRNITLIRRDASPSAVDRVFAHEYVHVLQCTNPELRIQFSERRWATSLDYRLTTRSLIEGTAVLVTDRYVRAHLPSQPRPSTQRPQRYRNAPPLLKLGAAPYAVGYRYVDNRIASPERVRRLYDQRPISTEQLLHNESRASEPVRRLGIDVVLRNDSWHLQSRYRMGELLVRTTLDTELDSTRARTAAAGWGSDAFYHFKSDAGADAYVWAIRWDNRSAATTFRDAASAYATKRSRQSEWSVSVSRYNETITLLVFGNPFDRSMVGVSAAALASRAGMGGKPGPVGASHSRQPAASLNRTAISDCMRT